ncbi:hypothetical protein H0H92_014682, partial [Tricholoma furcatifolium]
MNAYKERQQMVLYRMGQIKRWLAYQYWKDRESAASDPHVQDAILALLYNLTGQKDGSKPRRVTAANRWQTVEENKKLVDAEVARRLAFTIDPKARAGVRSKVVASLFKALPQGVQQVWNTESDERHHAALAEWERKMNAPPSKEPGDLQRNLEGLIPFMQRLFDLVCDLTGMKCTFMVGGPEPADGGRLNVISIHAGHTPGDVKMNFGAAEHHAHKHVVVPAFGEFLKKCY